MRNVFQSSLIHVAQNDVRKSQIVFLELTLNDQLVEPLFAIKISSLALCACAGLDSSQAEEESPFEDV